MGLKLRYGVSFLNASNKQFEKEIREKIIFPIASKGIKYLGINLTKEVKDSYKQNFKTLLKEIREDINKWKYNVSYIH